jgi:hypothetical protein
MRNRKMLDAECAMRNGSTGGEREVAPVSGMDASSFQGGIERRGVSQRGIANDGRFGTPTERRGYKAENAANFLALPQKS